MKPLEKFKSTSPPRKKVSKIQKFKSEVLELYGDDYSVFQIQDFLLQNGVKISTRRIYQFIKQNLNPKFFVTNPTAAGGQKSQSAQPQNSKAVSAYMQKLQKIAKEQ